MAKHRKPGWIARLRARRQDEMRTRAVANVDAQQARWAEWLCAHERTLHAFLPGQEDGR